MDTVKTAYAEKGACDKVLDKMERSKEPHRKELVTPLVDALDFLGKVRKVTSKFNQFRKDLLKARLPKKICQLTTNMPGNSTFNFEYDLNERIIEINSTNNTVTQTF